MKLETKSFGGKGKGAKFIGMLMALGVPKEKLFPRRVGGALSTGGQASFWFRNINHLEVLECARDIYRKQILVLHPDRGGCVKKCAELNHLWSFIERKFKQKGFELV